MRRVFLALVLCLVPALGSAQTHPCDTTNPTVYQTQRSTSVRYGFCHSSLDDEGVPIQVGTVQFVLQVGTQSVNLGTLTPMGGANAAGEFFYEAAPMTFTQDVTLRVVAIYNGVTSAPGPVITIDVRGGPRTPVKPRVTVQ